MSKLQSITVDNTIIRQDKFGRYSLNDLHKAAMIAGVANESQQPAMFLRNEGVKNFIEAVDTQNLSDLQNQQLSSQVVTTGDDLQNCRSVQDDKNKNDLQNVASVVSVKGGKSQGSWAVELVAIRYAAWINPHYEVKIYKTFQESAKYDKSFKFSRHQASVTYQVMSEMIQVSRELDGKEVCPHHFSNEALMINEAMFGVRAKIDRDKLLPKELDLIAFIEKKNTALIGRGLSYDERKIKIKEYADNWRIKYNLPLKAEDSVRLIEQQ